ncbi:MAG: hypothetical protein MPJ08_01185 [Nitrosopumilus sp.]|nr:hypothetical protein [Nitrosopumilus sp.]
MPNKDFKRWISGVPEPLRGKVIQALIKRMPDNDFEELVSKLPERIQSEIYEAVTNAVYNHFKSNPKLENLDNYTNHLEIAPKKIHDAVCESFYKFSEETQEKIYHAIETIYLSKGGENYDNFPNIKKKVGDIIGDHATTEIEFIADGIIKGELPPDYFKKVFTDDK